MLRAPALLAASLVMAAGCQSATTTVALQTMRVVTPSYDDETLVVPNAPQHVAVGTAQAFSVNPAAGHALTSLVGGTCPMGYWTQNVYKTGAIQDDCTVIFSSVHQFYDVKATATHVELWPVAGDLTVGSGETQAFNVTPEPGYVVSNTVGGTCAAGTWAGVTYTTGAIDANCSIAFSATPVYFSVAPVDGNVSTSPVGAQPVLWGSAQAFTVQPDSGFALSSSVTGTCTPGDWNGSVYTTGAINANCTVVFDAYRPTATATVTAAHVSTVPAMSQTVAMGTTALFTVTPDAGYVVDSSVGGTCPAGSWSGNTYTTGVLDTNCSISFSGTPFLSLADGFIRTVSLSANNTNSTLAFSWSSPNDTTTPANDQNYTLCASAPDPLLQSFGTTAQVLDSNNCVTTQGITTGALVVANGHAYLFNVVATNALGAQAAYQAKGEFVDANQLLYVPFENGLSEVIGGGNLVVAHYQNTTADAGSQATDRANNPNRAHAFSQVAQSCLETNGVVDASITGSNPRTITFWMRTGVNASTGVPLSLGGGNGALLATGDHFGLYANPSSNAATWQAWYFGDDAASTQAYADNQAWTMWTISYSGAPGLVASMYVNTTKVVDNASWPMNILPDTTQGPLFVGCGVDGTPGNVGALSNFLDGVVDDIRVFNRVLCDGTGNNGCGLTTNEILNLYNVTHP